MTDSGVLQIHDATMRILAKKGMTFHRPEAAELARRHGLKTEGETIYFTEKQLITIYEQVLSLEYTPSWALTA